MAEEQVAIAAPAPVLASKKVKKPAVAGAKGVKKPKAAPTHPPTETMVNAAISGLKERGGSSLLAIKKYLAANYKVDVEKLAPFIKKYLKSGVAGGKLIQTKGKGATGSFKLSVATKSAKQKAEKKATAIAKPKKAAAKPKKSAGEKVKVVAKKKATAGAAKAAKKSGSVKTKSPKEKKAKIPIVKAKAPKPKKVTAGAKKAAPRKTAAKK